MAKQLTTDQTVDELLRAVDIAHRLGAVSVRIELGSTPSLEVSFPQTHNGPVSVEVVEHGGDD